MIKFYLILLLLMVDIILFSQIIVPALGCGSTIGEAVAFASIPLLGAITFTLIKKILNFKK